MNAKPATAKPPVTTSDRTALAIIESIDTIKGALSEFDKISAGIAQLKQKYANVVYDCSTTKGMAEATEARRVIREPRYRTEELRKEAKSPVLALGRNIDARAGYITEEILTVETPIDEQIKVAEERKEQERQRKANAEAARVATIRGRIESIRRIAQRALGQSAQNIEEKVKLVVSLDIGADQYGEFVTEAEKARAETLEALRRMYADADAREKQQLQLDEQRAEMERRQAEQARLDAAAAERRRQEDEQASIARRQADAQAEHERIEADRVVRAQQQQQLERIQAEQRNVDERIAAERREREEAAATRTRVEQAAPLMLKALEAVLTCAQWESIDAHTKGVVVEAVVAATGRALRPK